jgi:hypothetical protein
LKQLTADAGATGSRYRWLEKTKDELASSAKTKAVAGPGESDEIAAALETE